MKNKKTNEGEFTKILKVRNLPAGKNYEPGFIISGKYLKNLGFDLFDHVWISSPGTGVLNIQKI